MLVKCKTWSHFLTLDLKEGDLLPEELIFVGSKARKSIEKLGLYHVDVKTFWKKSRNPTGLYIKKRCH